MLKFAATEIVVEMADGRREYMHRDEIARNIEQWKIARIVRRKRDGAIVRVFAKAEPNEIASRSHRTPTVAQVLPMTWAHNMRACAAYGRSVA